MTQNIDQRTSELIEKGYGQWLCERDNRTFYGMHVLEGEAYLRDERLEEKFRTIKTRIVLGRDIEVPKEVSGVHRYNIGDKATLLHALFVESFMNLTGFNSLPNPKSGALEKETFDIINPAIENYFRLNSAGLTVPLTLFYAHGETKEDLGFYFAPEHNERNQVDLVLREYKEKYFNGIGNIKPTILMATCNQNDQRESATIENPGFHLVYKKGLAGGPLASTGTIVADF